MFLGGGLVHDHEDGLQGGLEVQLRDRGAVAPPRCVSCSCLYVLLRLARLRPVELVRDQRLGPRRRRVQRTRSSPSASSWSRATAFSR